VIAPFDKIETIISLASPDLRPTANAIHPSSMALCSCRMGNGRNHRWQRTIRGVSPEAAAPRAHRRRTTALTPLALYRLRLMLWLTHFRRGSSIFTTKTRNYLP
jgi:hypothetical protein